MLTRNERELRTYEVGSIYSGLYSKGQVNVRYATYVEDVNSTVTVFASESSP
jgi:hypothetical protein